jgi:hypothetical protein
MQAKFKVEARKIFSEFWRHIPSSLNVLELASLLVIPAELDLSPEVLIQKHIVISGSSPAF